jgi:hypothetical protein
MNLQSWIKRTARALNRAAAAGIFGQTRRGGLFSPTLVKSMFIRASLVAVCAGFTLAAGVVSAQTSYYTTNGTEYAVIGSLPGDQVFPDTAISSSGGFMVWQDNVTDGDGWGVSARKLDGTLSGNNGVFRVNAQGTNDQENARVAMLKNGGAVFVWQGGVESYQHIFARFLTTNSTFLTTTDLMVSTFTNTGSFQVSPAVAVLNNSNVVVVWSSLNQAGSNSLLDVYAKILSPVGVTVSNQFLVNQFTNYNQRTPAVAALRGGGFVVAWVSEQQRKLASSIDNPFYVAGGAVSVSTNENVIGVSQNTNYFASASSSLAPSVDIYARLYQSNGAAAGGEFLVDTGSNPCANPRVAAASDGSFMVAWSGRDMTGANGWDVYARPFSSTGTGGTTVRLNTYLYGSQYAPQLCAIGLDYLAVWTSLGQDGSREGVYGQFVHSDGSLVGGEFRVNTTTVSQQMQPVVASDGVNQFLAVWTSYTGGPNSFDLFAQRYINADAVLQAMPAPFVYAPFTLSNNVYQPQLQVSWAPLAGISVSNYEVYVDGAGTPLAATASNSWTMTAANGLTTNATHSFQLDYVKTDGARSPLSPAATGTTWSGQSWGGIPYEWMQANFGQATNSWPAPNQLPSNSLSGSPTLLQLFLSGGLPYDPTTWLQQTLTQTSQGLFLTWNTQPGATYQVQVTTNLTSWSSVGSPRFAAGTTDSIYVGGSAVGYYRVTLLRQ